MKKVLCLVLVISLVTLGLVGCGGTSKSTPADNTTPEQAAAPDKTYKIRIAHVLQESTPTHKALVEFKNYVEEKSAGKISVEVYPNSSLGGERQICEAVQLGTLESALATTAVLANFEPKLTVFELPFLYNTLDIARKSVDGEFGKLATEGLNKVKIMNLAIMENGFRYITNSKRPIHTPKDLNGIKIRTMENPIHMETFRLLGASPTPMAFNELYTALQQKTVDGQENPVFLTYSSKFYEVQKYLSLTGHIYAAAPFVMNLDFFNSLPADLQTIVKDGANVARDKQREMLDTQNEADLVELKKAMEVNELTAEEKAVFAEMTKPVYDQVAEIVGQDLVDLAVSANEKYK